jgi:predicted negative regulator of RcsB-dependent stress response
VAYEDDEQLEALRDWWRRHGRGVVIGVVAALVLVVGWQQWQAWKGRQSAAAADDYAAVLQAINEREPEAAANRLGALRDSHGDTPYAVMATLAVATAEMAEGRAQAAADFLGWVGEERPESPLANLARLRQAEALAAATKPDAALAALEPVVDGPLRARYFELRGDLLAESGDRQGAIEAYERALSEAGGQRRSLVEVKLLDLGGQPAS